MENKNDKYDFSYFEDGEPYISHRDRAAASDNTRSDNNSIQRERRERPRRPAAKKSSIPKGRVMILGAGALVIILIVGMIIMFGAIGSVGKNSALKVSDVTDTGATFSWNQKKNVDGYSIYGRTKDEKEYSLIAEIADPDATSYTVTTLEQASLYNFYIAAVKNGRERKFGTEEKVSTLPSPPAITAISANDDGVVHVEWEKNEIADGYIMEYKQKDGEYESGQRFRIDKEETVYDFGALQPENYLLRMYSYMGKKDPVISPPSEEQMISIGKKAQKTASGATFFDPNIDPEKPMVAFTFDDGPFDGVYSDRILDALEKYEVTATFFMVGCYVEDHPENLKRKVDLHMELGNHTWDHSKYGESITAEDISSCSDAIFEVTGQRPTAFRPPGGAQGDAIINEATSEGMAIYLWNVNSEDYESRNADAIYSMVMGTLADGNIIGMHDTYEATAEAVERMIPEILAQGYQIVSAHDLVVAKTGNEPEPGEIYYSFSETNYE